MLQSVNNLPSINDNLSHPIFLDLPLEEKQRAKALKELLLKLSKDENNAAFSPILRAAADTIRERFIGYNRKTTKNKILKLIQEFECCEMIDFVEEYKIDERELRGAIDDLVRERKIRVERRRRWQEAGRHYNELYYLA